MRILLRVSLAIGWLSIFGCDGASEPSLSPKAVDDGVLRALSEFAGATETGDLDRVASFYCPEDRGGVVWFEDGQLTYPSREVLLKSIEGISQYGTVRTVFSEQTVLPLAADRAWLSTSFATTIGDPAAGNGFTFGGAMTVVMAHGKVGDTETWCATRGHTSTPSDQERDSAGSTSDVVGSSAIPEP